MKMKLIQVFFLRKWQKQFDHYLISESILRELSN